MTLAISVGFGARSWYCDIALEIAPCVLSSSPICRFGVIGVSFGIRPEQLEKDLKGRGSSDDSFAGSHVGRNPSLFCLTFYSQAVVFLLAPWDSNYFLSSQNRVVLDNGHSIRSHGHTTK